MYCHSCGTEISESSNFCRKCGADQNSDLKIKPQSTSQNNIYSDITQERQNKSFLHQYSLVIAFIVGVGVTVGIGILIGDMRRIRMPILFAPIYGIFGKDGLSILMGMIFGFITWLLISEKK
jgi:hypothetical protein